MIVAVIRRIQVIGISFRLLAPTLTAMVATAHKPSVAPANTRNGSYLAARLAVVSWVMSPHSARDTTPKLIPATRSNDGARPPAGSAKKLRPDVLNSRRSRPPRVVARRPGVSARRYVGQPTKDYSPSEHRISGFHPPGPVNAARSWQMWVFAVMPPAAWPRLEIEGWGEADSGGADEGWALSAVKLEPT